MIRTRRTCAHRAARCWIHHRRIDSAVCRRVGSIVTVRDELGASTVVVLQVLEGEVEETENRRS